MTMPDYDEIAKPTPGEISWVLCPACKDPTNLVPSNEAAAYREDSAGGM